MRRKRLAAYLIMVGISATRGHAIAETQGVHSAAQLGAQIRKLEASWDDPNWDQHLTHKHIQTLITEYVTNQLNEGAYARQTLEENLTDVIHEGMWRSWSEHPARVLFCCSGVPRNYIVSFALDEAAGGSTSVIQVYELGHGSWRLAAEGGSEMDGCDMDVLLLPSAAGDMRIFAHGLIFGANQDPTLGALYGFSGGHIRMIWKMKNTLGLTARRQDDKLVLEYRDTQLFYKHSLPDAFQDIYTQTDDGLKLVSHKHLLWDRQ
ncbi:MAG TPA: hypothetical protein VHZ55_26455 [Bryobacteraceae bacterium]|nr:hypothetical protein [Bryobacteraceae bacterium]